MKFRVSSSVLVMMAFPFIDQSATVISSPSLVSISASCAFTSASASVERNARYAGVT